MSGILTAGMRLFDDETLDTTVYRPKPLPRLEQTLPVVEL
jgi:hypothetical protein